MSRAKRFALSQHAVSVSRAWMCVARLLNVRPRLPLSPHSLARRVDREVMLTLTQHSWPFVCTRHSKTFLWWTSSWSLYLTFDLWCFLTFRFCLRVHRHHVDMTECCKFVVKNKSERQVEASMQRWFIYMNNHNLPPALRLASRGQKTHSDYTCYIMNGVFK